MAGSEPRSEGSLADADMLMSQTSGTSGLERMSAGPKAESVCVCACVRVCGGEQFCSFWTLHTHLHCCTLQVIKVLVATQRSNFHMELF